MREIIYAVMTANVEAELRTKNHRTTRSSQRIVPFGRSTIVSVLTIFGCSGFAASSSNTASSLSVFLKLSSGTM